VVPTGRCGSTSAALSALAAGFVASHVQRRQNGLQAETSVPHSVAVASEGGRRHAQIGEWRQIQARSESLAPFLSGLGVPWFAVKLVDMIKVDLDISLDGDLLKVVDKTLFGNNATEVVLGAVERETSTRSGRKRFMLSGFEEDTGRLTVQCRLFQRGDGWATRQSWVVRGDGLLQEQMVLVRPGEADVVVTRLFNRIGGHSGGVDERAACDEAPRVTAALQSGSQDRTAFFALSCLAATLATVVVFRTRCSKD